MPVEIRNHTPFPNLGFESRGHGGEVFHILVVKGTFRLESSPVLKPIPDQRPLIMSDEYHSDPTCSSVRFECDINPFKPATDIHLTGTARSHEGKPRQAWEVALRVGTVAKQLRVTGPRHWEHSPLGGWILSKPEPAKEVPIRYELAFGGLYGEGKSAKVCEENPVGRGFLGGKSPPKDAPIPAPQIESPDHPVDKLDRVTRPEGFGPIARSWQPRLRKAGTFDDAWLRSRWPDIPDNFDFAHYNSAHPDLIAPGYLKGDEPVELHGFHTDGPVKTALPNFTVFCLVRLLDGVIAPAPMHLDTIVFDVDAHLAYLTWRCRIPAKLGVRVLESRMILPKGDSHG